MLKKRGSLNYFNFFLSQNLKFFIKVVLFEDVFPKKIDTTGFDSPEIAVVVCPPAGVQVLLPLDLMLIFIFSLNQVTQVPRKDGPQGPSPGGFHV